MEYYSRVRKISWLKLKDWFWRCLGILLRCGVPQESVLLPTDWKNIYWTGFQLVFSVFTLYYASIFIVFDFRNRLEEIDKGVLPVSEVYTFNVFMLVFTNSLDILKGFNTAFYRKGEIVTNRRSIALNYLSGSFIFDALALFSVVINRTFFPNISPLLIYRFQFLFFFKLHLVAKLIRFFQTTFIQKEKYDNLIQLIRLLLILCLTSHINAILYHSQAQLQIYLYNAENTWIQQANLVETSYWSRYVNSFYCAVGTLVTSIIYNPKTSLETVYMSLSLLINCLIFGYLINELGNIMDNIERASKTSKKEQRLMNSFLESKKVNRELQTRIRNYLDYMHLEEKQLNLEETKIVINKLSGQLKQELMKQVNQQYIHSFELIYRTFSQKIQEKSLFLMKDSKYTPGEIIFKEGLEDESSIYLVWEGKVDIFHMNGKQEDIVVSTIEKGQCFGEISFFTGALRCASARSSEFTSLIQISRKEFMALLKEHSQEDYEIFQQINHTIQHSKDFSFLTNASTSSGKCFTCGSVKHMAMNCPLTHFAPLPVAVVLTSQRTQHLHRALTNRWTGKKWNPINQANLYHLEQASIRLEESHERLIEELCEFFGDLSDEENESDAGNGQQHSTQQIQTSLSQLPSQQQQQQQSQQSPNPRGMQRQTSIVALGPFERQNTFFGVKSNQNDQNHEIFAPTARQVQFSNSTQSPSMNQMASYSNETIITGVLGGGGGVVGAGSQLSRCEEFSPQFETSSEGQQRNLKNQQQQNEHEDKDNNYSMATDVKQKQLSAAAGMIPIQSANNTFTSAALRFEKQLRSAIRRNSNNNISTPKNSFFPTGVSGGDIMNSPSHSSGLGGFTGNNSLTGSGTAAASAAANAVATGVLSKFGNKGLSNFSNGSAAMKTVQALFRFKTIGGGQLKRKQSVMDFNNLPGIRHSSTQHFPSKESPMDYQQQQQLMNQQEELMNPHQPHPIVGAMQLQRQQFQQQIQQIIHIQHHTLTENVNQFGDPYSDLIEIFCGKISMRIDFMRNFTKYFFRFNIEEIEKSSIGKKMLATKDMVYKRAATNAGKKVSSLKKHTQSIQTQQQLTKNRSKKITYFTNQDTSRSINNDTSNGQIQPANE